jgi:pilus assembly protein CpaE
VIRLSATVYSDDRTAREELTRIFRLGGVAIDVFDEREIQDQAPTSDILIVDGRHQVGLATAYVERLRSLAPVACIVFIAADANSDVILDSMRSGANEFLVWPPTIDSFRKALAQVAARRGATAGAQTASVVAFIGAKGGAGTTTLAINCGVELASRKRTTVVVDLKPGLGDVALFLGVRSRYTLADALDNASRLDRGFVGGLVAKHVSNLEIIAGSEHFERPGSGDADAVDRVIRVLEEDHQHVVIDAGSHLNNCAVTALYRAQMIGVVLNPDVPSIRHTQRVLERLNELGAGERVRVMLNRSAEPHPIPLSQIESAIGHRVDLTFPSDYKTVATALNTGVPLTFSDESALADQFKRLTQLIVDPDRATKTEKRKGALPFPRIASFW